VIGRVKTDAKKLAIFLNKFISRVHSSVETLGLVGKPLSESLPRNFVMNNE
jgi:hypothetical protein